jgi:transcriptional regulator with XRE-family HTH domain
VRLREAAGLSREALAEAARVTTRTYREWERGRRTFSLYQAVLLALALGVDMNELTGWKGPKGK